MMPYYQHDGITIYCGDCREILPALPKVDLVLTDPPYGIALQNHAAGRERRDMDWTVQNDSTQDCGAAVLEMLRGVPVMAFASPMLPWPGKWKQYLAWEKGGHVGGGGNPATHWKLSWELLQVRDTGTLNGERDGAVLHFMANHEDYALHPTPKPVTLMCYLVGKATSPADLILDPFMGSGTTLVAAKRLGRRAIGVEIEEKYCEIAARRVEAERLTLFEALPENGELFEVA